MTDSIDIEIRSSFKDTGIKAAEAAFLKLQAAQQKAAAAAQKALASPGDAKLAQAAQKAAQAVDRAAASYLKAAQASARLATASGDAAGGIDILTTAIARSDKTSTAAVNAQTQLARALTQTASKGEALPRTFAGITDEMKGIVAGSLGVGAALSAAQAGVQSFADAFKFKAELDATTASINIQLQGVRDSGQVWNEAASYAERYKLTQEETANTVQASIGILRQSKASVEETFGVLQRLTVLAPGKSIEDAAFSVRELASGDITSIAEQFNISRTKAYEMRDAIQSGADVVQVLSGFLNDSGVSMDALRVRTEGAMGAMKDLALANEQLKIAQAELASGPGVTALQVQASFVTGLSRAISGDLIPSWDEVAVKAKVYNEAFQAAMRANGGDVFQSQAAGLAAVADQSKVAAAATEYYAQANQGAAGSVDATTAAVERAAAASAMAAEVNAMYANGANGAAIAAQAQAQNTGAAAIAAAEQAAQAQAAASALGDMLTASLAEAEAAKAAEEQARAFALAQEQIANLGGAVNSGLMTAADAAALLARQYNITTNEALALVDAQARIAGGQARLANQKAQTRDLVPGGVGVSSPGKRGSSDADILATVKKTTDEITAVGVRAQPVRTAAVKAGGNARASAEQSSADKIKQIAQDTAARLVAIDQRAAEQRAKAMASLAATIGTTSADMVASQEANDLELVGASEDRLAELSAREQAEAQARIASIEAVREARAIADAGDAEQAQAVLEQRQQQIQAQQALDEEYAKRRAELAGDPAATEALKTQYDEATAALADATQVRIDLAAQEAQQRADALAAEKQAVLDGASAQAAALGTTGAAADTATGKVKNLGDAIAAIPTHKVVTVDIVTKGGSGGDGAPAEASRANVSAPNTSGGSSGASKAKGAGGGTFVTSGPAHLTVGDNPGGVEMVTVTPISGVGTSSASGPNIRMAGGGTAIGGDADADAIRRLEDANRRQILPTASSGGAPARSGGGGGSGGGDAKAGVDEALKNEKEALQLIKDVADLRKDLRKGVPPPIAASLIADLTAEAARISQTVSSGLVPTTKDQVEALGNWRELVGDSVGILKDVGSLSSALFRDYQPPSVAQLQRFAEHAQDTATAILQASRVYENDALENAKLFSEGVGATFETIGAGLQVFDRLRFSDLGVDPATLRAFTASSLAVLDSTQVLAERAGQIDAGALSSLSAATAAINAQAEALINLSAVPTGNLGGLAAGLGGGSSITFGPGSIVINGAAPGMDMAALANLVARQIQTQIGSRR